MTDLSWLTRRPVAHRGLHDMNDKVWENTLRAFARAIDKNYTIECDVHLTLDNEVVVFHDNDLRRLAGEEGYVWQKTAAEMGALSIGTTRDHAPTLQETLDFVAGRVPLVVELKGIPGHDAGLVAKVGDLLKDYPGKVAIMSFDHWLIRNFSRHAPGIPGGLTAWGVANQEIEAHFSMLAHDIAFVSYAFDHLPNRFVGFVREKLAMPVITWTVRDEAAAGHSFAHADQITFEGFEPPETGMA
ncbi:glycerophosphodiester phosphodiesterase [Kumtagia ephedrae]|uniref:Glycerophosphodiester phosphodiesterase n=1 Tax=Kumtagia ephedrae TaxID=2116701 RepID=A0A2P7S098_9HYPH|nr:glycerophosphodiester phosphodiesterase [Mesorhizobium ephedrae]PSJ55890.1 glycerophosphodiester phosphodiesterase [Mesorhizobium ephedrae]